MIEPQAEILHLSAWSLFYTCSVFCNVAENIDQQVNDVNESVARAKRITDKAKEDADRLEELMSRAPQDVDLQQELADASNLRE